jgi:ligand-binding SRPBCC domain-containing protein
MPTLIIETEINAPPEICFELIRAATRRTNSVVETDTQESHDEIRLGETVAFESKSFGFTQKLVVKVTEAEKPRSFTDEMIEGNFKFFRHVHEFIPQNYGTLLRDVFVWASPFGIIGKIADELFVKNLLRKTATRRNAELKRMAESKFPIQNPKSKIQN